MPRVADTARIWPHWVRSVGAMIEAEAVVRFACERCRRLYDVDLEAIVLLRGRACSLVDRKGRCKASTCRANGWFVAAPVPDKLFILLTGRTPMPAWLAGARPRDHDPDPNPNPPAPPGVDPIARAYADVRERKQLMRLAALICSFDER